MSLTAVLLLGACKSLGGDTPGSGEQPGSPEAYRPEVYQQTLRGAGQSVSAALAGIASARTLTALSERLVQAEQAASQAAEQLGQATPPEGIRAEHADLGSSFKQLGGDLGVLRDSVEGRELCAPSAVMARLGKAEGLVAVRDAAKALSAKGSAQGYKVDLLVPPIPREQNRRLSNGQFVRKGSRTGRGELTVDNGSDQDTVITVALGKRSAFSVYVRKGSKHKVAGIRDGTYRIYYTTGEDWDSRARAFTRDCSFERFDDTFKFETTESGTRIEWTTWTITLQPVVGGTASTSEVNPNDFPAS